MKKDAYIGKCAAVGAAVLLLTHALGGCRVIFVDPAGATETTASETLPATYTYRIDIGKYRDALFTTDPAYRVLVNKTYTVDAGYAPMRLSTLDASLTLSGKEVRLESTVALAAEALLRELWAYGWTDILVTSGYRTYSYQSSLFNQYIANERAAHPDWTYEQAVTQVLTYSARPGTSEHQTGLTIDVSAQSVSYRLDQSFGDTKEGKWLAKHCHEYGFIIRYPYGKEKITGYSYEPWHIRYVGTTVASYLYKNNLTLEEYYGITLKDMEDSSKPETSVDVEDPDSVVYASPKPTKKPKDKKKDKTDKKAKSSTKPKSTKAPKDVPAASFTPVPTTPNPPVVSASPVPTDPPAPTEPPAATNPPAEESSAPVNPSNE